MCVVGGKGKDLLVWMFGGEGRLLSELRVK
jgi:hypothetical protein